MKVNVGPMQGRKLELVIVDFSRPEVGGKKEETSRYPLQEGEIVLLRKIRDWLICLIMWRIILKHRR